MLHELVAGHVLAELRDAGPEGGGLPRYSKPLHGARLLTALGSNGGAETPTRREIVREMSAG